MNEKNKQILDAIKGQLIVSCQALPSEPLHSSYIMSRMAYAAYLDGSKGIRANSVGDIIEIKKTVDLPVIGIIKIDYEDAPDVYITPTMKEVDALVEIGVEIIAMDATKRTRSGQLDLDTFFKAVREKYPDQLLMADCSTVDEMIHADELGFDFIGSTLVGYTKQSKGDKIEENDFEILRTVLERIKHPLIAEGNIDTPEKVKRVLELGAYSVVVG